MVSSNRSLYKRIFGCAPDAKQLPLIEVNEKSGLPSAYGPAQTENSCFQIRKLWLFLKLFIVGTACLLTLFYGQSIVSYASSAYPFPRPGHEVYQGVCSQFVAAEPPIFVAKPPMGKLYTDRTTPTCSSSQSGHGCDFTTDADINTNWQTADGAPIPDLGGGLRGHWVAIDLGKNVSLHSLAMTPRDDARDGGAVSKHVVQLSTDGTNWQDIAYGTWFSDRAVKYATFEPRIARHVRLVALEATNNANFVAISDLSVFVMDSIPDPVPNGGIWGITLNFPIVPVGAFVNPISGNVVTFSSYRHDGFDQNPNPATTLTATWDRGKKKISNRRIENTKHDMFCPGTSFNESGHMTITGGSTNFRTSIYDSSKSK
jgi:galactose oxidase